MSRSRSDEGGFTLIEVLIATVVLSLTATSILTMLSVSVSASATHRNVAQLNTLLVDFAETATYQIELAGHPAFAECSSVPLSSLGARYDKAIGVVDNALTGDAVSITSVASWNPTSNSWDSSNCTANGLQQLTITATTPAQSESMTVVVRNPNYENVYSASDY